MPASSPPGRWFLLNAQACSVVLPRGDRTSVGFTGKTELEAETFLPQLGVNLIVLDPGEPNAMYHWEADQEDFLVLSGEPLLIVEEERRLRQWDFVHCSSGDKARVRGSRDRPCAILATSSREFQPTERWGAYVPDELALPGTTPRSPRRPTTRTSRMRVFPRRSLSPIARAGSPASRLRPRARAGGVPRASRRSRRRDAARPAGQRAPGRGARRRARRSARPRRCRLSVSSGSGSRSPGSGPLVVTVRAALPCSAATATRGAIAQLVVQALAVGSPTAKVSSCAIEMLSAENSTPPGVDPPRSISGIPALTSRRAGLKRLVVERRELRRRGRPAPRIRSSARGAPPGTAGAEAAREVRLAAGRTTVIPPGFHRSEATFATTLQLPRRAST